MSIFNEPQGHVNILWETHTCTIIYLVRTHMVVITVNLSWGPCNFCACVCCFYENLDIPICFTTNLHYSGAWNLKGYWIIKLSLSFLEFTTDSQGTI